MSIHPYDVQKMRGEAQAIIRYHEALARSLSEAVADVDNAIMLARDTKSIDEQEQLRAACQRLSERLNGAE